MTSSILDQYNSQTQNGIKNAGLDTVMTAVNSGTNLTDLINQGYTPQSVGQYKDASGNMVTAAPGTMMISKADGSGGALNYFFTVNPKTGVTAPIANAGQNLTYSPGSPGGFINGLISSAGDIIKTAAPVALSVFLASEGIDPTLAGAITGATSSAANGGNLGDIAKGALTGGAAGYVGGAAGNAAGGGLVGAAAGGAASGATTALLSGQNPIKGAFTGALAGSVVSQIPMQNGGVTYNFDDGSSLQYDASGKILGGTDSTGAAIPQSAITAANAAPVETATPVSPDAVADITKTVSSMEASNASPADIARALQAQGYTQDQVIGAYGPGAADQINSAFSAMNADNATIQDTIKTMQAQGASQTAIAKALQAQGFTASDTISAMGFTDQSAIDATNTAFNDATTSTASAAGNATGGLSNEDADNIDSTIKSMQASGASDSDIARALSQQGYTAEQVIAVTGPDSADEINAAYATLNSSGKVTGVNGNGDVTQTQIGNGGNTNTNISGSNTNTNTGGGGNNNGGTSGGGGNNGGSGNTGGGGVVVPVIPNTGGGGGSPGTTQTFTGTTGTSTGGPIAPETGGAFTNGLINPGLNPGMVQVSPAYNTTNPSQDMYYWGQHPYEMNANDIGSYNNTPNAPATPWGLQNMQNAIGYDAQGRPIYAPASAPATRTAAGPQTVQQQLNSAWASGDYGTVQNLINQNNITTTQANTLWGPGTAAAVKAAGVNLIQPTGPVAAAPISAPVAPQ